MKFHKLDEATTSQLKKIFKAALEKDIQSKEQLRQLANNLIVHVGNAMMVYQFEKECMEYSRSADGKNKLSSFKQAVSTILSYLGKVDDELPLGQLAAVLLEEKYTQTMENT